MYAYDVDGDGDNDVITASFAHGYGLVWWEQVKQDGEITFKQHQIMGKEPSDNKYGVKFSQLHAVDLIDMDIQGAEDCVIKTGATLLDSKAKRIHVSTHSNAIEASIREIMKSLRWICEWDFPFYKTALTPYGKIFFTDGVQAWRNPRWG